MRMQVDELTHVKADVDYSQIPPIQQKRIIAFVNHFVTNTVSYLNNFSQSCESRFMEFEYKMQKIEASLLILEAQLSSIPGFDKQEVLIANGANSNDSLRVSGNQTLTLQKVPNQVETLHISSTNEMIQPETEVINELLGLKASEDPRYAKFFKMVRVGVNEQAVRLKMQSEGIDSSILDNPDVIIPDSAEELILV